MKSRSLASPAVILGLALGLGCRPSVTHPSPAEPSASAPIPSRADAASSRAPVAVDIVATMNELSLLARGHELSPAERREVTDASPSRRLTMLDAFARGPAAAEQAAMVLLPGPISASSFAIESDLAVLHTSTTDAGHTLLHRWGPCEADEVERVTPWWSLETPVRVCARDHQPERIIDPVSGTLCGDPRAQDFDCGCGPWMMSCNPDLATRDAMRASLQREIHDTVAHLVAHDAPLREIFVTNGSFRDRRAELWYRRARVVAGEPADEVFSDYGAWPAAGRFAPRPEHAPGQQAGVLTTGQMLWIFTGPRERVQLIEEQLWCVENRSVQVDTDRVFALGTPDFSAEHDQALSLAETPVCDTCHARIDHAMPFFRGHQNYVFIEPRDPERRESVYVRDRHDPRAEGPATPNQFAVFATAQPEFGACMARRVVDHVFGPYGTAEDHQAVLEVYRQTERYTQMLATALRRRLSQQLEAAPAPTAAPADLRSMLDTHCRSCHGPGDPLDLSSDPLERDVLYRAVREVAYARMPRGVPGPRASERRRLLSVLAQQLWPDPGVYQAMVAQLNGELAQVNIARPQTLQRLIHARAGTSLGDTPARIPEPYGTMSRSTLDLGPDMALFVAIEATRACSEASAPKRCAIQVAVDLPILLSP